MAGTAAIVIAAAITLTQRGFARPEGVVPVKRSSYSCGMAHDRLLRKALCQQLMT